MTQTEAESVPVLLLDSIGRAVGRRLAAALAPTGLKPRHADTLVVLRAGPLSQRMLGETLGLHPVKLVALLNDLETAGLIVRRREATDRRRHVVVLSELGRARVAAVDFACEKLDAALFADVGPAKRALLVSLLERVAENLGIPIRTVPDRTS